MKSTGIVRRVDDLGRVVIPKELRGTLGIDNGDPLEIFVNGNQIVLRKYAPGCVYCGSIDDVKTVLEKPVCKACGGKIISLLATSEAGRR